LNSSHKLDLTTVPDIGYFCGLPELETVQRAAQSHKKKFHIRLQISLLHPSGQDLSPQKLEDLWISNWERNVPIGAQNFGHFEYCQGQDGWNYSQLQS